MVVLEPVMQMLFDELTDVLTTPMLAQTYQKPGAKANDNNSCYPTDEPSRGAFLEHS
jgi:hypothetical protein